MQDNRPKTQEELHQKVMSALEREFEQVAFGRPYGLAAYHCGMISADANATILVGHTVKLKADNINLEQLFVLHDSVELLMSGIAKPSKLERAQRCIVRAGFFSTVSGDTIQIPHIATIRFCGALRAYVCHFDAADHGFTASEFGAIGEAVCVLNETEDQ